MAKSLVITEKPSVARDIAAVLGGFREEDGFWESDDYVVTFAVGHLFELLEPEEVDERFKRWTLAELPVIPERFQLKKKKGHSERIRTIQKLLARDDVDTVVNACDAGREGELIFQEIVKYLGNQKPVRRLWLQSMTPAAIRTGFQALRPGEELAGLAAAAECRAYSDWLIGMNATRALTKRLKSRKERTAWSAGRVQTPTLAILVEREAQVLAHVPRPYWRVTATFLHQGEPYEGVWFDPSFQAGDEEDARDDRIFDEERARAISAAVGGAVAEARETRKPSRETAPPLFDLTSLQREANRRFGWSARRALSAAQRCYEAHKILTYPRTDSRCLPNDYVATVDEVLRRFAGQKGGAPGAEFAPHAERLLANGLENKARTFDDAKVSDHFAIIPTGEPPPAQLSGDDKRLFELVTRRFLGNFHPPALWERVERTTEAAGHSFRTRARALVEAGWREVLPVSADEEDAPAALPALRPGETEAAGVPVRTDAVELQADETRPPARLTEAALLSRMENAGKDVEDEDLAAALHEKGLGTPATRAEVIENLIAKGYAVRVGKALRPTVKGIRLIDTLKRVHIDRLASAALTGEIESHLQEVEKGAREAEDFLEEMKDYAREIVETARTFEYDEIYAGLPSLGPCPSCGRDVYESTWFYRCEEEPKRDPDCPLRFWKDTSGRYLDRRSVEQLIKDGRTGTLDGFTARNGRTYKGHLELDRDEWKVVVRSEGWNEEGTDDQPEYEVDEEPLGRCPLCDEHDVVETAREFTCAGRLKAAEEADRAVEEARAEGRSQRGIRTRMLREACGFVLPRTVCKREITRDEALRYLAQGRTELLTDFTSRFGRPFSATLFLKENARHGFEFPPRGAASRGDGDGEDADTGAGRKGAPRRKTAKASRKSSSRKTAASRKGTRKKASRKKKKTAKKRTPKPKPPDES